VKSQDRGRESLSGIRVGYRGPLDLLQVQPLTSSSITYHLFDYSRGGVDVKIRSMGQGRGRCQGRVSRSRSGVK
ncbi:hypothetical protein HAX54_037168, partial [Datura stramonium]|nr:hypothetical protein [Datura stramonium]